MTDAAVAETEEVVEPVPQEVTEEKTGAKEPATIAEGKETKEVEDAPYWADDWQTKIAEYAAAGDKEVFEKELKRIKRFADPAAIYGAYRETENKIAANRMIPRPRDDASEEEIAEFRKALGVPETPEQYFDDLELSNGAQLGEDDKPLAESFAKALHERGATKEQMSAALDWYYNNLEEQAAELDARDDEFRRTAEQELKEELGSSFKRKTNAITSLFATAPGGVDPDNGNALFNRLMAGRMADGSIIGDDPDMVRFLVSLASEVNPSSMVMEDGDQSGKSIAAEIAEINKFMRENRREYFKDQNMQDRLAELLEAQQKIEAQAR